MRDIWYGDKRDLIKWGGILHLCSEKGIRKVVQVAYYRKEEWADINFDGVNISLDPQLIKHFRDLDDIKRLADQMNIDITIFKREFDNSDRQGYHQALSNEIKSIKQKKTVFLDPDTGLSPKKCKVSHVKSGEIKFIWESMNQNDVLVLYQHRFWPKKGRWQDIRKKKFAECCGVNTDNVKMWSAKQLANDVVFYFIEKS